MISRPVNGAKVAGALIAACLLGLAVAVTPAAYAQAIMESNRAKLTFAEVEAELAKVNPAQRAQFVSSRTRLMQVVNNLYLNRVLAGEARALGLDKDPVLARQIELQVEKLLAQARLDRLDEDTKASLAGRAPRLEARAREIYVSNPARFKTPEQVHVAHILVKVGADGDAAALARAEEIRNRVVAGAKLSDLARELSDDPSAKRNGGDLGMVPADKLDPAFAKAALALSVPDEVGPVVKSSFGYHVLQFKGKKPSGTRSFDEVKAELIDEIGRNLVTDTRSLHMSLPFQPAPDINEALLDQLVQDAQRAVPESVRAAPVPR